MDNDVVDDVTAAQLGYNEELSLSHQQPQYQRNKRQRCDYGDNVAAEGFPNKKVNGDSSTPSGVYDNNIRHKHIVTPASIGDEVSSSTMAHENDSRVAALSPLYGTNSSGSGGGSGGSGASAAIVRASSNRSAAR